MNMYIAATETRIKFVGQKFQSKETVTNEKNARRYATKVKHRLIATSLLRPLFFAGLAKTAIHFLVKKNPR